MTDDVKDEYDFSKAERGRSLSQRRGSDAACASLTRKCKLLLTERAAARDLSLDELVNALLKKDIELIEAAE